MLDELDENEANDLLYEHHNIVADVGQDFVRLDKFLVDRLANSSRNKIQNAATLGHILVNGKAVKSNYKVKPFDEVSIQLPYPPRNEELLGEDLPLQIEYEDDDLLIIQKQPNMVVHPGFGNMTGTLVNALVYHFDNLPSLDSETPRPGIVHRLDKNTTGLMVIAKTENALRKLSKDFADRNIDRRYHALVWGNVKEDEGTITGNIGRSIKDRKVFMVYKDGSDGRHAVTHYKVLERFGYVTLVECKLETGRTHQIRVHMKHIGHTLFNDYEYGGDEILKGTRHNKYKQFINNCFKLLPRQALHAKSLGITHPTTGEYMFFEKPLPNDMESVLEKWRTLFAARELED